MAAACTISAPADLFGVCNKGPWVEATTELRFLFAGILICCADFQALLLDAPFTHVQDDPAALPPPPAEFPRGIEAARISACPIGKTHRAVTLLPRAIRYVSGQSRHFYIDLEGSFAGYLQRFRSKSRSTLKRKVRRYCEAAGATQPLRKFSRPDEMKDFHRLAMAVATRTYQHRLLDAGLPASIEYQRSLADRAAQGRTCGFILTHGETPAAYCVCHVIGGTFTLGKMGFDPAYSSANPGTVMLYLTIEHLFAEGKFRLFDLGCGDFAYKEFLATGHTWCGDVLFMKRSLRNGTVVLAHRTLNLVTDGMKKLLDVLGLKARVKKLIHYGI